MKKYLAIVAIVFMVSCKPKAVVTSTTVTEPVDEMKATKIIDNHYSNKSDFSTLYIKANARYADDKQAQNVTAEIKIKKDQQILVSIRFIGITMAKASITPTSVSYYEKIKGTYFDGDFSALSQWLGTDLDYNKIQNMLTGEALDDLNKGKYTKILLDNLYRLDDSNNGNTKKSYYFNPTDFSVNKQEVVQEAENRSIQIAYPERVAHKEANLPSSVEIKTAQPKGKSEINLNYNSVSFNEELSFPYSIPDGYKRIIIK
ncbi:MULTISPECIES: DUF4292 domain-containing protein [Flavobacterium]|uniref:DUF4292 domain-containing protein n=1 Tax=Flavobacterium commune TaxID=1306519 RepID=A0A1D9P930_9FLAO|nr:MULTISPECIES: DUF4292 domain-containing protein [Flavobacterium]AOZ99081.1 hypothetical protein BIW12_06335 [Flavobacterium commune]